jgi:outer membrane receptor protein involved in Fe transport
MTKKLFYPLVGFLLLAFIFSFAMNVPLYAQEEKEEEETEDIEDFSLEELLDVEITTAGKRAEKIGEIPASVVLVTREDVEKYGYQTLAEVLENIPGLYSTNDYVDTNFGVRGFWTESPNRNMIILVNGIPQVTNLYSIYPLSHIAVPVEAIDRIEVVRGPMSVIYGTGAFFGVINIITNQVEDEAINMVSASVGSDKTKKAFLRLSGRENDFQYSFNASYFDTYGIDASMESMGLSPAAWGLTEDLATGGRLENEERYFNFSGSFRNFSFGASYSQTHPEVMFGLPPVNEGNQTLFKSTRLFFGYKKEFSEKVTAEAKLVYFNDQRDFRFDFDVLGIPGLYGREKEASTAYKAELDFFFNPNPNINITVGVDYFRILTNSDEIDIPIFSLANQTQRLADGESMVTQSLFAQLSYRISDKFRIVAGARLEQQQEYTLQRLINGGLGGFTDPFTGEIMEEQLLQGTYSETGAEFIPRVAAIYTINESNILKFLYGKAINRPSFFQNLDLLDPARSPLDPETIQTLELNYIGYLSSKYSVSLSIFRNMLDKLIYRSVFLVGGVYSTYNTNVGEIETNGLELTIKANPSEAFQFELSGTYQDTKDQRPGLENIDVGYSPKILGYLKASYFINKDISLAVTGTYVDEMEAFWDVTIENPDGSFGSRIGAPVDSYFLLGANLRIRNMFGTGLFLNLRGSNLLDKEIFYPATSNNSGFIPNGSIGRALSFLLTVGWKF